MRPVLFVGMIFGFGLGCLATVWVVAWRDAR